MMPELNEEQVRRRAEHDLGYRGGVGHEVVRDMLEILAMKDRRIAELELLVHNGDTPPAS